MNATVFEMRRRLFLFATLAFLLFGGAAWAQPCVPTNVSTCPGAVSYIGPVQVGNQTGPAPNPGDVNITGSYKQNGVIAPVSTNTVTTPGGVARTLASWLNDVANVLGYTGIDPLGIADSSTAINNAAASTLNGMPANVYMPAGVYHFENMVSLTNGQCLSGDSKGNTIITVGSDFNPSAAAVIQASSSQDSGPCVHDLTIQFALPSDAITVTTQASSATATTITVSSVTDILVNGSVTDATASAAIPALTTVTSIVGNVVHLSNAVVSPGVGNGDSIHFGPSRSTFKTLAAGCTTGLGGTGCEYPPAIQTVSNSTRSQFYRLKIQGAWTGISTAVNSVMWLDDIEMSALYCGLCLDNTVSSGTKDFSHIHGYHFWDFGFNSTTNLYSNVYLDGGTFAAIFGEVDGVNVTDFTTFVGRLQLTSNFSWGQFENVEMDGTNATLEINGTSGSQGLQITNLSSTGAIQGTNPNCQLQVNAGNITVSNLHQANSASNAVCVGSGASLRIVGGYENPNSPSVGSMVSAGALSVYDVYFGVNTGAGLWTTPVVNSTAGTLVFQDNAFNGGSGSDTAGVSMSSDGGSDIVAGNQFNGWPFTPPGILGAYNPNYGNPNGGWISFTPGVFVWGTGTLNTTSSSGVYQRTGSQTCVSETLVVTDAGSASGIRTTFPSNSVNNGSLSGTTSGGVPFMGAFLSGQNNLYLQGATGGSASVVSGISYYITGCYESGP